MFQNRIPMKSWSKMSVAAFAITGLLMGARPSAKAALGLDREAYGVWDRGGNHSVTNYPYTRGQAYADAWAIIEPSRTNFNWTALDSLLQFANDQNQKFNVQILPSGGPVNPNAPSWMTNGPNSVPLYSVPGTFTYGNYTNANYKAYFQEMVEALATHLRTQVATNLQARIGFVRCDTGSTGDEVPYANASDATYVQANYPQYYIDSTSTNWLNFRLWAFEVYRHAFQDGTNGPVIPLLFQDIEITGFPTEWNWVTNHVVGGFGGKYGGQVRGHNLTGAQEVSDAYRGYAVGGDLKVFSRNEMDQTWQYMPMFQTNLALCMYWCAVEQLHPGMSVWDISASCLENTPAGGYADTFSFFNKWAAELDPPTAGGGFCIFHDGLDSSDTARFSTSTYGAANGNNTNRYALICAANATNGARMDDLYAASKGQVYQRDFQIGFNDSGWQTVPGNYERFITQLEPTNSPGVWRISGATNGVLTSSSHPFDRFGRRFDHANGKDAMFFDINDNLVTSPGQRVQLTVIYRDTGTGQFALRYDALTNSQKTAFTVTKGNSLTWKTNTVVVTDWAFANRGPKGADLVLTNLGSEDTIFHSIELVKLANVNVGAVGKGTVSGRTDGTAYSPILGAFTERQRLELTATPAAGWKFTGWSGDTNDLTGGDSGVLNARPFFFPTNGSQLTASFAYISGSGATSVDNFNSGAGVLTGGTGWSGGWVTSGTVTVTTTNIQLTGSASITRTNATALTNATLSFDWDLDKIATSKYGLAEVFDGSWHVVWSNNIAGTDSGTAVNLTNTTISLIAYGSISKIRFTFNGASSDVFWIDNVSVISPPPAHSFPLFSSDPINLTSATNGDVFTGTLTNNASDPGGNPLTFSKVSGPGWLSVSNNGVLYGTPLSTDVGLNSWLVRITNGIGGSDDAILLINVIAVPPPIGVPATIVVADSTGGSAAISSLTISNAFNVNTGNVLVANLSYRGVNNQYGFGPATLNWVTGGGAVTQTMTRAVEAGNTAAKAYGSAIYYLWNPKPGSGTISGSLPSTNTAVHIVSAFTLTGVDTNVSPVIASNIDDNQTASSITSSTANVPVGGFASLCAASAGTANGTGFTNSPAGGAVTNWFQNNFSGGYWDQGYILGLGGGNTTFSCAFVGGGRMHIVAAVFTPATIFTNNSNIAPVFTVKPISRPSAGAGLSYSNTLAGSATDANFGDTLTYSKVSNVTSNTWLNVATNGTLSGAPGAADVGTNSWMVQVADGNGGTDTATINIVVLSAYTVWANQYSLTQGSAGDDDGDGFKNLYEYAIGGNPTNASDHGFVPTFTLKSGGGSNWCEFVHAQRSDPNSGLLYSLQLTTNLVTSAWTNTGYTVVGTGPLTNGFLSVTNRIDTNLKSQQFIRLRISGQ